jgi:hypothetical protein
VRRAFVGSQWLAVYQLRRFPNAAGNPLSISRGAVRLSRTQGPDIGPGEASVKNMVKLLIVLPLVVCSALAALHGAPGERVDAAAVFSQMKRLVGTWVGTGVGTGKATTTFELTANGTVLLERYSNPSLPGGGHMVTAYHLDGAELILTHYCIASNQPVLRAERYDPAAAEIQFEFLRATNLASPGAGHMRRAKYRLQDGDHFTTEWEFFEAGSRKMTEVETFTRIR